MNQLLNALPNEAISFPGLALNFFVGVFLAFLLDWHYKRFGTTLANRSELARIFPMIALTTFLVITVVKSSLALSLGLVGALSVIRFRTPIKEPEELAYLFLAIAVGLGLGASQTIATAAVTLAILTVMAVYKTRYKQQPKSLFLSISLENGAQHEASLEDIIMVVDKYSDTADLRRVDSHEDRKEVVFLVRMKSVSDISALTAALKETFQKINITILDQNHLPSL